MNTALLIKTEYPELSKYLLEMPETIPDAKFRKGTQKNLKECINSLKEILDKYAPNQSIDISKI